MKKIIKKATAMILAAALAVSVSACAKDEIHRTPVDCRKTEQQWVERETKRHGMNPATGKLEWITYTYEDYIPASCELEWYIQYSDGTDENVWLPCTEEEYNDFKSNGKLEPQG